jgi:uncharacterized membrane protein YoaK (UPF0700 family)
MAIQNATQRVHFSAMPPTTLMTGNTTQAVMDAVDLLQGVPPETAPAVRARFYRMLRSIASFAAGCAAAAGLYVLVGFWALAVPVIVGALAAFMPTRD